MKIIEEYTDSQLEDIFDSLDSEDESGEARRAYAAVASRLGFRRQRNTIRKVALKVSAVVAVEASTSAPVPYAVEAGLFAQAERETTARSITRISAFLFITDYLHVWFALLLYSSRRFPAKV
mgnify:CR=1 FL=1